MKKAWLLTLPLCLMLGSLSVAQPLTGAAEVTGLTVSAPPYQTEYKLGEPLNLDGGKLGYTDGGNIKEIPINEKPQQLLAGVTVSDFDSSTVGKKEITVSYGGQRAAFEVTVVPRYLLGKADAAVRIDRTAGRVVGIAPGTTEEQLKSALLTDGGTLQMENLQDGKVKTGTVLKNVYDGKTADTLTAVVYGDVAGTGDVAAADVAAIRDHLLGTETLTGVQEQAAQVLDRGEVTVNDLLAVKKQQLGLANIDQNPAGLAKPVYPLTVRDMNTFGRTYDNVVPGAVSFNWTGAGFEIAVEAEEDGESVYMEFVSSSQDANYNAFVTVVVNDQDPADGRVIQLTKADATEYKVADGLSAGKHTIKVYKRSEGRRGTAAVKSVRFMKGGTLSAPPTDVPTRNIEVVGDSISCGYGNYVPDSSGALRMMNEDGLQTYSAIAARQLKANLSVLAVSGNGVYKGPYGSSDPAMPNHYESVCSIKDAKAGKWDFEAHRSDVVVVNLGTNDTAAQDFNRTTFETKCQEFVKRLLELNPTAKIVCCTAPMIASNHQGYIGIHNAVEALKGEASSLSAADKARISLLDFSTVAQNGEDRVYSGNHPGPKTNQANAAELVNHIKSVTGWK